MPSANGFHFSTQHVSLCGCSGREDFLLNCQLFNQYCNENVLFFCSPLSTNSIYVLYTIYIDLHWALQSLLTHLDSCHSHSDEAGRGHTGAPWRQGEGSAGLRWIRPWCDPVWDWKGLNFIQCCYLLKPISNIKRKMLL